MPTMPTEVVRSRTPEEDELERKLAELALLEAELAQRELDLATLLGELHLFERRYLRVVGVRYAQLDELLAKIAEASAEQAPADPRAQEKAAEARSRAEESAQTASEAGEAPSELRFEPPESLKKLYREVARAIHPDLATDEQQRARRTRLMAEANRAYEERDDDRLQAILQEWETSPEAIAGQGPAAELVRAIRKIAQVRSRLDAIEKDMDRLRESPIHELKVRVEEAESEGRDLLGEMAAAVEDQIAEAKQKLARILDGVGEA